MSFDLNKTLEDMLAAAKAVFGDEWPDAKDDMQRVLNDEKEALKDIAEARIRGEINDEELEEQLKDEKEAFEAGLSMVSASTKATIQHALNAASEVFWNAVRAAI
ncbi:MAG: hypothetical protein JSV05_03550 [Candidatus Bathyarchaeota archaeon]|jgi:ElaB/YqjD/DUF883 family membrane-anchored ribosome-binding protein|nr:MAG: hypothetical protein JSV05_03550 [Candidatus Bathyarchaeota archaeon]